MRELFELRCMQTDPNWSNFLYDVDSRRLMLIDFGSTRFYTEEFMENYRSVIKAAVRDDANEVLLLSRKMAFLTGYETKQMEEAHVNAVMILGELFRHPGEFDFGRQVIKSNYLQRLKTEKLFLIGNNETYCRTSANNGRTSFMPTTRGNIFNTP